MRKKILLLILLLMIFYDKNIFAHDDQIIHPEITKISAKRSSVENYLQNNLDLKKGFDTVLPSNGINSI